MARLFLRIDFGDERAVGPGKIRLLELIREHGSISAAGRAMDMSYRRAWLLVDELNRSFREPVVATQLGGSGGGGTVLTPFGEHVVATFRTLEQEAGRVVAPRLDELEGLLAPPAA